MHHHFLVVVVQLQRENGENYIITSLPNSEHKPDQLNAQISVIAEKKTTYSSQDSFAYNKSRGDSCPQPPQSPLEMSWSI